MSCTEYRIYPDGTVLSEDEYEEDVLQSYSDDYKTVEVPDEVRDHIIDGFVALLPHEANPWEVGGLFVTPEMQGRGIGHALIRHAAELKGTLTVLVYERNEQARRAYDRMGFELRGKTEDDAGFTQLEMIRTVQG